MFHAPAEQKAVEMLVKACKAKSEVLQHYYVVAAKFFALSAREQAARRGRRSDAACDH